MKKHFRLLGVAALATTMLTGCSNDELVETNQGEAIAFRARTETRATAINKTNLGNFKVYAKGVHTNGALYPEGNFLIGTYDAATKTASAETAKKKGDIWKLDREVYWPSDMSRVFFWAYTTNSTTDNNDNCLSSGTITFNQESGPVLTGFTLGKDNVTTTEDNQSMWMDGDKQKDLLFAFTNQLKTTSVSSIPLTFKHALSQIEIQAKRSSIAIDDHRIVKIKGAWIMNTYSKANLIAGFKWENNTTATENTKWTTFADKAPFGSYSKTPKTISEDSQSLLDNGSTSGSLMLFPSPNEDSYKYAKWNHENNTEGTYLLLLCRIELQHQDLTHDGTQPKDILVDDNNNCHYHQLFPSVEFTNNEYNENAYGFSCVSLPCDWEMGKKYIYNLDICSTTSGAGVYPPEFDKNMLNKLVPGAEQENVITNRPKDKEVGSPVLDDPITFNVTVDDWTSTQNPSTDIDIPETKQ